MRQQTKVLGAVKIVSDYWIHEGDAIPAGAIMPVTRRDKAEHNQTPAVCVMHEFYGEVIVYPQYYTDDLSADHETVWKSRVASKIQKGYKSWIQDTDARRLSPEFDYGGWWTFGGTNEFDRWRVSWIESTGELYAANERKDEYILLAKTGSGREQERYVDNLLEGWANPESPIFHNLQAAYEQIQARSK